MTVTLFVHHHVTLTEYQNLNLVERGEKSTVLTFCNWFFSLFINIIHCCFEFGSENVSFSDLYTLIMYKWFCDLQGTTAEQDNRFADKKKKLMKQMRFGEGVDRKVCIINVIICNNIMNNLRYNLYCIRSKTLYSSVVEADVPSYIFGLHLGLYKLRINI